jgi:hypothetical protein
MIRKIISGGQTGADLGGLEGARECGIRTGGTAPPNWISGGKPQKELLQSFGLVEGEPDSRIYPKRTMKNVDDSDGTVAILWGNSAGTNKTIGYCTFKMWTWANLSCDVGYRPVLVIKHADLYAAAEQLKYFINLNSIKVLNVAGHRETSYPGIQEFTKQLIINTILLL